MSKRALIYARLSPAPKGEEAKGGNLDQQVALSRAVVDRNEWTLVDTITEVDTSATSRKPRAGWRRVVEQIEAGEVDVVIGRHYDRLYRRPVDLEELVRLTEDYGVRLVAAEAGDDGLDLTTATGRAQARYMAAGAAMETDLKRERQVRGHERRAEAGKPWWNVRPLGYERDGEIREDEAEHVRQAYRDLLAGHTLYAVAKRWNEEGFTTPKDNPWRSSNLRTALLNPRNAAIHSYRGTPTGQVATWEPLVDEETFHAVHRMLTDPSRTVERAGGGKRVALLTHVAKCGLCGDGMIQLLGRPRKDGSRMRRYTCRKCRRITIPADWLDRQVLRRIATKARYDDWLPSVAPADDTDRKVAELRTQRDALDKRLKDLGAMYAEGAIEETALRSGTERARARLAEVTSELDALTIARSERETVEHLDQVLDLLDDLYDEKAYDTLRSVIAVTTERVECQPRGRGKRLPTSDDVVVTFREGMTFDPTTHEGAKPGILLR